MGSNEVGTQRLLRTPRPELDESLVGYVVRLTEANYYESIRWVTDLAGLRYSHPMGDWISLNRDATDLSRLEALTGNDRGSFDPLRYGLGRYEHTVNMGGAGLPASVVKFRRPKMCPACLREANYCRKVWDLLPYTACHVHGVVLLDICPGCGGRISWSRNMVSRCRCGFDWCGVPKVRASQGALKASQQIGELCSEGDEEMDNDKEPLYRLGLAGFCEALTVIADHYLRMKGGKRLTANTENLECHEAFSRALSALEGWPRRFEKFLHKYGLGNAGGVPEFMPILELHRLCKVGDLNFMTVALEEFIEEAASRHGEVLTGARAFSKRFITVRELGMYIKASPAHIETLLRCGRIHVFKREKVTTGGILIDLDSTAKFKEKLDSSLTSIDVGRRLGVSIAGVVDLVRHGCLRPVSGPTVDGLPEWRFERDEPSRLLERIVTRIVLAMGLGPRERILGGEVLRLLGRDKIGVGRFIRDVLAGSPTPRFTLEGGGLIQFGFSRREINEYINAKARVPTSTEAKRTLNFRVLARSLENMMERNERSCPRGLSRQEEADGWNWVGVNALARIAMSIFSKV